MHDKPRAHEIAACRPWLEAEVQVVKPELLVALGATGPPGTWQDWSRLIFTWGMGAVAGAQGYHARELVPSVANGE